MGEENENAIVEEADDLHATSGFMRFGEEITPSANEANDDEGGEDERESTGEDEEAGKGRTSDETGDSKGKSGKEEEEEEENDLDDFYAKRMREVADLRARAGLADRLEKDPQGTVLALAKQFGVDLGGGDQQTQQQQTKFEPVQLQPEENESAPDFFNRLISQNMQKLSDFVSQTVQTTQQRQAQATQQSQQEDSIDGQQVVQEAIAYLDKNHKDWPIYEKEMLELLDEAPQLAFNPARLYKLAKGVSSNPSDRAKAKKGGKTIKKTTTVRSRGPVKTSVKGKKLSFDEAWAAAKNTDRR